MSTASLVLVEITPNGAKADLISQGSCTRTRQGTNWQTISSNTSSRNWRTRDLRQYSSWSLWIGMMQTQPRALPIPRRNVTSSTSQKLVTPSGRGSFVSASRARSATQPWGIFFRITTTRIAGDRKSFYMMVENSLWDECTACGRWRREALHTDERFSLGRLQ